ncbi:ABC transporter permease [Candidatus Hydrogenedentota bacterium]
MRKYLHDIFNCRNFVFYLVSSNIKAVHRHKVLGNLWTFLDPLLLMLVYYVVFALILRSATRTPDFLIYLFVGIIVWRYFQSCVMQACTIVKNQQGLITEVYFPKAVLPISTVLARGYDFIWSFLPLYSMILLFQLLKKIEPGTGFSVCLLWLPLLMVIQLAFNLGFIMFVTVAGTFFADMSNLLTAVLRFWFYMCPIFYYIDRIPEGHLYFEWLSYHNIYMLNPYAVFFTVYRTVIIDGRPPAIGNLVYVSCVSIVTLIVGFIFFRRFEGVLAKYV